MRKGLFAGISSRVGDVGRVQRSTTLILHGLRNRGAVDHSESALSSKNIVKHLEVDPEDDLATK